MHFKSLLHIRDHSKAVGTAGHLLEYIALHVNYHTGEAFDLTVARLAHRLAVTPQWVGQLKARLVATGELLVKQKTRERNGWTHPYGGAPFGARRVVWRSRAVPTGSSTSPLSGAWSLDTQGAMEKKRAP
jgi:hypothetical protein